VDSSGLTPGQGAGDFGGGQVVAFKALTDGDADLVHNAPRDGNCFWNVRCRRARAATETGYIIAPKDATKKRKKGEKGSTAYVIAAKDRREDCARLQERLREKHGAGRWTTRSALRRSSIGRPPYSSPPARVAARRREAGIR
jgi:hypothetical protein